MSYYECGLCSIPDGSDSPSRLALVAGRLGYSGIIICNRVPGKAPGFEATRNIENVEVVLGAEITTSNPRSFHSHTASLRKRFDFLIVRGGSDRMIRTACEDPKVDLLIPPRAERRWFGIAAAKAAKENQVAIGLDLSPMIRSRGGTRIKWIEALGQDLKLIRKFEIPMMITSGARSHLDLRAPRELKALARLLGLEEGEVDEALRLPGAILDLNRRRWAAPGVEVL